MALSGLTHQYLNGLYTVIGCGACYGQPLVVALVCLCVRARVSRLDASNASMIAGCEKAWFPDRQGLISGLTLLFLNCAPLVYNNIQVCSSML